MGLDNPVIAVIGAGAVGGYYGARLAQRGFEVHFLLRGDYDTARQRGLSIRSCDGDFVLPPDELHVHRGPAQMPRADLVIVALKALDGTDYRPLIAPLLKPDTAILTLQNGLGNEEHLAELFGAERILGGLAFVCINRIEPAVIHHMDYGYIRLGELGRPPGPRARRIAEMLAMSRIRCDVLEDLRYGRWEKLVWNVPFNGLGAALDLRPDELLASDAGEQLVRSIMNEVIATAAALDVNLPRDAAEQKIQQTRAMRPYRSSMQIDRQLGRPMEIEAIIGRPLRAAREAGVAVPHIAMLHQVIRAVAAHPAAAPPPTPGGSR